MARTSLTDSKEVSVVAADLRAALEALHRGLQGRRFDDDGLTPTQASILSLIDEGGPITPSALAAREQIRPQSVATILTQLFRRRFITRSPAPSDARSVLVSITARGVQALQSARADRSEQLERALREILTTEELGRLSAVVPLLKELGRRM